MTATIALIALLCLAAVAGSARSHRANQHPAGQLETPRIHEIYWLRGQLNRTLDSKCLPSRTYRWKPAYRVPVAYRPMVTRQTGRWWNQAKAAESRCIQWWPWGAIADCETGDRDGQPPSNARWGYNGSSGFDGGVQFHPDTWNRAKRLVSGASVYAYAWQAPAIVQVRVAQAWLARTSWSQWPHCSSVLGLR